MPDPISWSFAWPYMAAALVFGYLCGSIPFGLLLTRMAGLGDVRSIGSGNIGATNVLRTGNKKVAAATLLADILKGTVAVLLAGMYGPDAALVAGLGAFLGHLYPVWLKFKGGKGVATYLGVVAALAWPAAIVFAVVWLAVAFLTRYSSLSALCAMIAVPLSLYFRFSGFLYSGSTAISLVQAAQMIALMSVISIYKHRQNIARLLQGTESKIGAKG
ncbi:MAG: glycerol-3-phosphate 1-O-acyltransferase PlsY [Brucellaceae bacterium]|nr:glycerol-3-phosphate 1-O-acyltransferase PlsY [Brucellaceae bacterium]